ncbi:MAG: serine/threonine protein kinase [Vicinamibacteria bacterium]|nr:serine/threonine protein kinase [Vicinamibacteria bacterium]
MSATRVGLYELLEPLGQGGMGVVYRARDPRLDRPVAVKVLRPALAQDPRIAGRFRAEAILHGALGHPHIVSVLDFVADGRHQALVMELVPGPTLAGLQASGALPVPRLVAIVAQVLDAIAFAHDRSLVHRDLKPSNVLVQSLAGRDHAKVTDFGIAHLLGGPRRGWRTAAMGTPAYMAPEQLRAPGRVDQRSDIYSIGVILFELLAGRPPFEAESETVLEEQIATVPAPSLAALDPVRTPPALAAVVARALEKDPARRFETCVAMRAELLQACPPQPEAHPASLAPTGLACVESEA